LKAKLNILISTFDKRIHELDSVLLDPMPGVYYTVVHQYSDVTFKQVPSFLNRKDVSVTHLKGRGVTKSRNLAIKLADGEIGLFSDDDVKYEPEYFEKLIRVFDENKGLDIGLFKIKTLEGEPEYKNYSPHRQKIDKAPSVGTVEIAFRVKPLQEKKVFFDERFGAGNKLLIGSDEKIFVQDCLKAGLNVEYFPEYIVQHPYESTVNRIEKYDKRIIWVTGGYDCRTNGPIAILKSFLGTLKIIPDLIRYRVNPLYYLYHRLSAVIYILRTNNKNMSGLEKD